MEKIIVCIDTQGCIHVSHLLKFCITLSICISFKTFNFNKAPVRVHLLVVFSHLVNSGVMFNKNHEERLKITSHEFLDKTPTAFYPTTNVCFNTHPLVRED